MSGPAARWRPIVGVIPGRQFGASAQERDRVAQEAAQAAVLISAAALPQARLLERLARSAPGNELEFPSVSVLERFLVATQAPGAAALPDAELAAVWRDAERVSGAEEGGAAET